MGQLLRVVQRAGEGNRAICCAWRNIWHERRTAGSLSARKNDRANTGRAVTRPRPWTGLQKGSMGNAAPDAHPYR